MELNLRRIKAERIAKGYTQDVVAEKMGWKSRTPYVKRENGIVPFGADELAEFGNILGYGVNELGIFLIKTFLYKNRRSDLIEIILYIYRFIMWCFNTGD